MCHDTYGLSNIIEGTFDVTGGVIAYLGCGAVYLATLPFDATPNFARDYIDETHAAIGTLIEDPFAIIEDFMQETSDNFDEKGIVFGIGTLIPDIALIIAGTKGLDKVLKFRGLNKLDDLGDLGRGVRSFKIAGEVGDAARIAREVRGVTGLRLDVDLLEDLVSSGAKHNADDIVIITKTPDGKLLWLENGNEGAGLRHIIDGHADDFAKRGIDDIPQFLEEVLQSEPIEVGVTESGPFAEYLVSGKRYRVAYGTNGYIVSFFPI